MPLFAASDEALGPGIQIIGLTGAAIAFLCGLYQYSQAQKWKRLEFVAQEMKAYESDPVVQIVFQMLDWGARVIPLLDARPRGAPTGEEEAERIDDLNRSNSEVTNGHDRSRWVRVTKEMVIGALEPHASHENSKAKYTAEEVRIRDCFDRFFDHWSRFGHYIQTGLVEYGDCYPYLAYWLRTIYDEKSHRDEDFRKSVQVYIASYYSGTGVDVLLAEYRARA
jgi:hypothetical protein